MPIHAVRRSFAAVCLAVVVGFGAWGAAHADDDYYNARVAERLTGLTPEQHADVVRVTQETRRQMREIFARYDIDPAARPNFDKLMKAGDELQAMQRREADQMKRILTREQYQQYRDIIQDQRARVIKATRE